MGGFRHTYMPLGITLLAFGANMLFPFLPDRFRAAAFSNAQKECDDFQTLMMMCFITDAPRNAALTIHRFQGEDRAEYMRFLRRSRR